MRVTRAAREDAFVPEESPRRSRQRHAQWESEEDEAQARAATRPSTPQRHALAPPAMVRPTHANGAGDQASTARVRPAANSGDAVTREVTVSSLLVKHHEQEDHQLLSRFFSSPPDLDEDHYHVPMTIDSRRAMWAALSIFAVSLVAIGGYTAYHKLIMPTPVELGGAYANELVPVAPPAGTPHSEPEHVSQPMAADSEPASIREAPPTAAAPMRAVAAPRAKMALPASAAPAQPSPQPTAAVKPPQAPPPEASNPALPSYEELVDVGRGFARKRKYAQALAAFERALGLSPEGAGALAGLAYVHLNMDDPKRAKQLADQALAVDPTNSQALIVLGVALEALGDRAGARAAYKKCATEGIGSYVLECRQVAR